MPDREKVSEGLQKCAAIHQGFICESCEYPGDDCAVDAAIALLKAQEPIEARLNLCESCTKEYPECDATADGIEFGCGVGNDNVIGCTAYVNRWKAQESRVMTLDELSEKTDVWFESLVYDTIAPALSSGSYDDGTVGLMTLEEESFYMDEADYGTKWRCWTSRPTAEQRGATLWN